MIGKATAALKRVSESKEEERRWERTSNCCPGRSASDSEGAVLVKIRSYAAESWTERHAKSDLDSSSVRARREQRKGLTPRQTDCDRKS